MKKNKLINLIFLLFISFCMIPICVSAKTIKNTTIWTSSMDYANVYYYTKDYGKRETQYIAGFVNQDDDTRVFCIEPGATFPSNKSYSYTQTTSVPSLYKNSWDTRIKTASVREDLKQVLSCWNSYSSNGNYYSIAAAQAVVWELVTGERSSINATNILSKSDYSTSYYSANVSACATNNATSVSNKCSLYSRIKARSGIFGSYKALLRCAARFDVANPSWAGATATAAKKQELNSYNDNTQTFSRTFAHGSKVASNLFKYYTYEIDGQSANCAKGATVSGITCSCNEKQCTFSTKKEITKPVLVEFKYTYKDDGSKKLNSFSDKYKTTKYYKKTNYQTLMTGSTSKSFYISLYTAEKPEYQIKVTKVDSETNKPIKGVKFDIFTDKAATAKNKVGTTTATDNNGVATYNKIKSIGTYYLKEVSTPAGYKTNGTIYSVQVKAANTVAKGSYATVTVKNSPMKLNMTKYTIDEDGNKVKIDNDACKVAVCADEDNRENGPIFIIKKDNKNVCVTETGTDGKYIYASLSDTCASGTTNKIKTCNGEFSIANIPAGTYDVTETAAACGTTLPTNPTKTITVSPGADQAVTMENGVTGVVFHKMNENGNLLTGGSYTLQRKENGVYKDMLLKYDKGVIYKYDSNVKSEGDGGTYLLNTHDSGIINVLGLPAGEYRFVEKEAPAGYNIIKDKDSTATFTISDKGKDDYYYVQLINHKTKTTGSYDSAELIITIITGRKVINYVLVIGGLVLLLVGAIIIRKKIKK